MAECVVCRKPLTLFIESEEEDEDEDKAMASSSAPAGSYVDDDVQLECGCHFHWFVTLEGIVTSRSIFMLNLDHLQGHVCSMPTL